MSNNDVMSDAPTAARPYVASKWVTWLLLFFGICEVPWVIYLIFFQPTTVEAYHVRLTGAGLGIGGAIVGAIATVAVWRRSSRAALWAVAMATTMMMLATTATLAPKLQPDVAALGMWVPLVLALVGTAAAIVATVQLLRVSTAAEPRVLTVTAFILGLVAAFMLYRGVAHLFDADSTELASHTRALVVVLDTAESIGLIGAGWASLRGYVRATAVFGVMAATLLIIDAYTNVVAAEPGPTFWAAIFYLIVGEIPSTILALIAALAAAKKLPVQAGTADLAETPAAAG